MGNDSDWGFKKLPDPQIVHEQMQNGNRNFFKQNNSKMDVVKNVMPMSSEMSLGEVSMIRYHFNFGDNQHCDGDGDYDDDLEQESLDAELFIKVFGRREFYLVKKDGKEFAVSKCTSGVIDPRDHRRLLGNSYVRIDGEIWFLDIDYDQE